MTTSWAAWSPHTRSTCSSRVATCSTRSIHARLRSDAEVRYVDNSDPEVNDRLLAELHPGALVINATGMGKDTPGSPITDAAEFPRGAHVWELNYRGELEFLHQAQRQAQTRGLRVEDGWRY